MERLYTKRMVVVEGKGDVSALSRVLVAPIVETHGTAEACLDLESLAAFDAAHGLLLFLDPDGPGRRIRARLAARFPEALHAEVRAAEAHKGRRCGVAHAGDEALRAALLASGAVFESGAGLPSAAALTALGLAGPGSVARRAALCKALGIAPVAGRQLALRLWALDLDERAIGQLLQKEG